MTVRFGHSDYTGKNRALTPFFLIRRRLGYLYISAGSAFSSIFVRDRAPCHAYFQQEQSSAPTLATVLCTIGVDELHPSFADPRFNPRIVHSPSLALVHRFHLSSRDRTDLLGERREQPS